ncbi:segregation and condensation protein A [uncultured Gulosibacter sp.]|uniref:segregation and condensation protein A n=1 Tax=uncultured Gulosibacter sp. TaxID=1339167 RepID=UPI0037DCD929
MPQPDATPVADDGSLTQPSLDSPDAFQVSLEVFEGPFDLLLQLIAKHELDITEISLSKVTDEFISHVASLETAGELDQASEFIVVAATLLDMKLVSLLPQGDYVDAEDVAVLEARDVLFARLLQYRAYKEAAKWLQSRFDVEEHRHARTVPLEPQLREREPELVFPLSLTDFAALAAIVFTPKAIPTVGLDHLHAPLVSIREQATVLVRRLRENGPAPFTELVADADTPGVVIARFLAVLELYRRAVVALEQEQPLGSLTVSWQAEHWSDEELGTLGADYEG